MISLDNLEKFWRPMVDEKESERAEYIIPMVYSAIEQEARIRGVNIDNLDPDVLDMEVAGIVAAFMSQPTDMAATEADAGYNVVYAPVVRISDKTLARLGIRRQVISHV